jgi:hypothetical protein
VRKNGTSLGFKIHVRTGGMKKYRTVRVLKPTATQPGPFPPYHVLAITATGKKNQNGSPNGTWRTSDKNKANDTRAIARL